MTLFDAVLLFTSAIVAGGMNSIAGGGSFVSFPALLFTGVPAIAANATSAVALWPGSIASTFAYRRELRTVEGMLVLSCISFAGGLTGALLLLSTPETTFRLLVPWLLLMATGVFAFGPHLTARLRSKEPQGEMAANWGKRPLGLLLVQLVVATYGGYFGGGIGIIMLAALTLSGMTDLHQMNALKNWLATVINGIAVITFIIAGAVLWNEMAVMVFGAIIGGFSGVAVARRVAPKTLRRFVISIGTVLTVYFFLREYGGWANA